MSEETPFGGAKEVERTSAPEQEVFVKKKRKKASREEKEMEFQITSLLDIFTILLVFLIKSYSANPIQVQSGDELVLPSSTATILPQDAVPITITRSWILVDNKPVVAISDDKVDAAEKENGDENSFIIQKLRERLMEKREEITKMNKYVAEGNQSRANEALVIADLMTKSRLLTEVLYTAGQAEFNQFRFATIEEGQPAWNHP